MKNKFIVLSMFVFSLFMFVFAISIDVEAPEMLIENVESMTQAEEAERVKCYCSQFEILGNKKCAASNGGNLCAQSAPGANIQCNEYNSNCDNEL